jgi:hypothetical protein
MTAQRISGFFVLALSTALIPGASASGLLDSSLSWQYYAGGTAYNPGTEGSVTSGTFVDGVGGTFTEPGPLEFFTVSDTDTTITFDYSPYYATDGSWSSSPLSLAPTIYNGVAIDLSSGESFANVVIDPATNMTGFSASNLSFTGNEIQLDWSDLPFSTSTIVTLDVSFSTPEPGTRSLMVLTLFVVGLIRRRRFYCA